MKVCILGSGAYGLALSTIFNKNNYEVVCYSNNRKEVHSLTKTRLTPRIENFTIPKEIKFTNNIKQAVKSSTLVVIAVPARSVDEITKKISKYVTSKMHILIATKGIENKTCQFMSEVVERNINTSKIAVISGPTFAKDIVTSSPIGLSLASTNLLTRDLVKTMLENETTKVRETLDIIGVEVCGAIKNVMAILSGILDGMNTCESTKALFLTKALNEGKVDIAFNYYKFDKLTNNFDYSFSPYNEKVVVLTSYYNVTTSANSLISLKGKQVLMLDNKLANYMSDKINIDVKTYKKPSSLFNSLGKDKIVIMDYNTYNYYKNNELSNYKVIYEQDLNTDYNFILLNTNKNKAFVSLYKYYISTINTDLYKSRALLKFNNDSKKIDLTYIYMIIGLTVLVVFSIVYFKNKNVSNKIKKEDKMRYVDHLTSLKNRHYLNENYIKWQANKIYPQAIIVININKVGHINDVYGHEEGDMVIRKAANILINNQLEQSDIVRTNGDEFLIYMVGYEETKVITYMRRLYKEFKNLPYKFGASLGYSMILDDVKTIDDAINEAVLEIKTNKESSEDK